MASCGSRRKSRSTTEVRKDEREMSDQGLIDPALAGPEPGQLFGVRKDGRDPPAALFARDERGEGGRPSIGDQVLEVPMFVTAHDRPHLAYRRRLTRKATARTPSLGRHFSVPRPARVRTACRWSR